MSSYTYLSEEHKKFNYFNDFSSKIKNFKFNYCYEFFLFKKSKNLFEDVFDKQDFDIINYGNKINSKIIDFKIETKEMEEINN